MNINEIIKPLLELEQKEIIQIILTNFYSNIDFTSIPLDDLITIFSEESQKNQQFSLLDKIIQDNKNHFSNSLQEYLCSEDLSIKNYNFIIKKVIQNDIKLTTFTNSFFSRLSQKQYIELSDKELLGKEFYDSINKNNYFKMNTKLLHFLYNTKKLSFYNEKNNLLEIIVEDSLNNKSKQYDTHINNLIANNESISEDFLKNKINITALENLQLYMLKKIIGEQEVFKYINIIEIFDENKNITQNKKNYLFEQYMSNSFQGEFSEEFLNIISSEKVLTTTIFSFLEKEKSNDLKSKSDFDNIILPIIKSKNITFQNISDKISNNEIGNGFISLLMTYEKNITKNNNIFTYKSDFSYNDINKIANNQKISPEHIMNYFNLFKNNFENEYNFYFSRFLLNIGQKTKNLELMLKSMNVKEHANFNESLKNESLQTYEILQKHISKVPKLNSLNETLHIKNILEDNISETKINKKRL